MSSLIVDVAKIIAIEKHPNADRLRIATVKGWNCIIGLDDFQVGDLIVFIPPDSVLPDSLCDKYNLEFVKKGGRVKTVKLRGYISQGLCLPLPEGKKYKEGHSMAKEMGITKYEPPTRSNQHGFNAGQMPTKKKLNPLFDKYTNIENIKNYNAIFKEGDKVVITEKIHGTNFRAGHLTICPRTIWGWIKKHIFKKDYEFVYGSHNVQKKPFSSNKGWYGEDVYGQMAKKYNLAEIIPKDYIVYGEIYGPKIQELTYGMIKIDLVIFDVKYKNKYLDFPEFLTFCEERQLPMVPIHYIGDYSEEVLKQYTNCDSALTRIKHKVSQMAEGCVVTSYMEEFNPRMGRKILKSINTEYLLTKKRTEYH